MWCGAVAAQMAALAVLSFAVATYLIYMKTPGVMGGLLLGEHGEGGQSQQCVTSYGENRSAMTAHPCDSIMIITPNCNA
jgi:hypothetical protein